MHSITEYLPCDSRIYRCRHYLITIRYGTNLSLPFECEISNNVPKLGRKLCVLFHKPNFKSLANISRSYFTSKILILHTETHLHDSWLNTSFLTFSSVPKTQ